MKALLALFFAAVLVVSQSAAQQCHTLTAEEVPFCKFLVGHEVDWIFSSNNWNGKPYTTYVDDQLRQVYENVVAQIQDLSTKNNYAVCEDCETQFKWLLCAGAFPSCGYYDCITPLITEAFQELCPSFCQCQGCTPFISWSQDCTKDGGSPNPNYNSSVACDYTAVGNYILKDLNKCLNNSVAWSHCKTFVDVCSCSKSDYQSICSYGFAQNGYTLPNWPSTGSCSAKNGWCVWTSNLANNGQQTRDDGSQDDSGDSGDNNKVCPNNNLCIEVPEPLANRAAKWGWSIEALNAKIQDYVSSLPPLPPATGAANALVATPLLVVLGLFVAVLLL